MGLLLRGRRGKREGKGRRRDREGEGGERMGGLPPIGESGSATSCD